MNFTCVQRSPLQRNHSAGKTIYGSICVNFMGVRKRLYQILKLGEARAVMYKADVVSVIVLFRIGRLDRNT